MNDNETLHSGEQPLKGIMLILAALLLSIPNFVALLDMTIANVSVSTIAGGFGISQSQGTWVITSYAVAEAITVPLTGWLAGRFGAVRVFVISVVMFGIASALCGMSGSLGFLVVARVIQGFAGGPIMPLSQTLLLKIFPKEKAATANALWAMTTVMGPVLGPLVGGYICDNMAWQWIFFINVPIAIVCGGLAWPVLRRQESALIKTTIDVVGLVLLVIWVGALQIMLDEGKELDWFASPFIVSLAVIAVIGFVAFLIWELTAEHPVVDLRVFRHRGYTVCVITLSVAFGAMFAVNVLNPLWLQGFMEYTSTASGQTVAWMGVLAIVSAPVSAALIGRMDARIIVSAGVGLMGIVTLWRATGTTDMTYWDISTQLLVLGAGMPMLMVPVMVVALGNVDIAETASAAGLLSFARTLAGAFAASISVTAWEDSIKLCYAESVENLDRTGDTLRMMLDSGLSMDSALAYLSQLTQTQAVMLATNHVFFVIACILFGGAAIIWLAPRPEKTVDTTGIH